MPSLCTLVLIENDMEQVRIETCDVGKRRARDGVSHARCYRRGVGAPVARFGATVYTSHIWNAVNNLRFVSLCKLTKDASRIFLYRRYA